MSSTFYKQQQQLLFLQGSNKWICEFAALLLSWRRGNGRALSSMPLVQKVKMTEIPLEAYFFWTESYKHLMDLNEPSFDIC